MKKFIAIFGLLSTLILLGCGESYPKNISVYSFDTAIVKYEIKGASNGEETVYIRGDQRAIHRYVEHVDGTVENKLELRLGGEDIVADLDKMTAIKVKNEDYEELSKMSKEEQSDYLIRKELGLKDGAEVPEPLMASTVAGQTCDNYEVPNIGVACIWNGIVLNKEISMLGIVNNKTAVNVQTDIEITNDVFELPAGVILKN